MNQFDKLGRIKKRYDKERDLYYCSKCKKWLPKFAFPKDAGKKSKSPGICGWCKQCKNNYRKEHYYSRGKWLFHYTKNQIMALKRANFKCEICGQEHIKGKRNTFLCVHHLNWDETDDRLENLMVLCHKHHMSLHKRILYIFAKKMAKKYILELTKEVLETLKKEDRKI